MTDTTTDTALRPTEEMNDLSVCVDCVMYIANGELPETHHDMNGDVSISAETFLAGMEMAWPEVDQWHLVLGSPGCEPCADEWVGHEPWFSKGECDGCRSRLGGDRMHASAGRHTDTDTDTGKG